MSCYALILAGGSGSRFSSEYPKQYEYLGGMTVLRRSLEVFLGHEEVDGVYVVYDEGHEGLYWDSVRGLEVGTPICGGRTRQESCYRGLCGLEGMGSPDKVLIHDAARPLVDSATITRVCEGLRRYKGVVAGVPVVDTLKRCGQSGGVVGTLDRRDIWRAQTPQGFDFATLLQGHRYYEGRDFTDDASILEELGEEVLVVEGSVENVKITRRCDLDRARRMLGVGMGGGLVVTGLGFDVHRFVEGRRLVLCGVEVEYELGLLGHSDADVGLHALTDGILGSMGLGDIGDYFPPTDMRWRDVDSRVFLGHALDLVRGRGGEVCHVDVTLLCERPRLGGYKERMRRTLGELCGLGEGRTSIKATTTEGLGFTGRGEGIAAQALVTVRVDV